MGTVECEMARYNNRGGGGGVFGEIEHSLTFP